ncbi:hypothetical protein HDE_01663 [Halotydeus destructor]|nr:hypothetical protein HDE_01663 [Halotydeus destructor]
MNALALAIVLLVVSQASARSTFSCDSSIIDRSDNCIKHLLLFGRENVTVPRTVRELDNILCATVTPDLKCASDIRKCMSPFLKTIYNLVARGIRKGVKEFCGTREIKTRTVRLLRCFRNEDFAILFQEVNRVTAILEEVEQKAPTDALLPNLCCTVQQFLIYARNVIDKLCTKRKDDTITDFIFGVFNSLAGDAIDLGCGNYRTVEQCQQNLPDSVDRFNRIDGSDTKAHTPIIPLLRILDRLNYEE